MYKLEKRADSVIHWLERMKKSYRSGAVESACMDAQCARADLELLSSDVFSRVTPANRSNIFLRSLRVIMLSVMIVMLTNAPISRENAPVTQIAEAPQPIIPAETPKPPVTATDVKPPKPRKVFSSPPKASKPKPPVVQPAPKKTVAYDKVYSLVQTGQRALKNDNSVIKLKGEPPKK